jgi:hypothetical protein
MSFFRGKIATPATPFYLVGTRILPATGGIPDSSGNTLYYLYYLTVAVNVPPATGQPPTNTLPVGFYALPVSITGANAAGQGSNIPLIWTRLASALSPVTVTATGTGNFTLKYSAGKGFTGDMGYNTTSLILSPTTVTTQTISFYQNTYNLSSQSLYAGVQYQLQAPGPLPININYLMLVNPTDPAGATPTTTNVMGEQISGTVTNLTCADTGCNFCIIDAINYTFNPSFAIPAVIPSATFNWFLLPAAGVMYNNPSLSPDVVPYNPPTATSTTTMLNIFEMWAGINPNTTPFLFTRYCSAYPGGNSIPATYPGNYNIPSGTPLFLTKAINSADGTPLWSGCVFTTPTDYTTNGQSYWYNYCPLGSTSGTTTTCGSCYGVCPTAGVCQRDYAVAASTTITVVPLSCNARNPAPVTGFCATVQTYKTWFIVGGIVIGAIILIGLILMAVLLKKNTTNNPTAGLKYSGGPRSTLTSSDL